ncbi:SDA1-domain-containing protein [Biscogniauxia sp. FL1348]|nr:SDA1-domain-containing protein [Biscogniauxia sp. FL1348]
MPGKRKVTALEKVEADLAGLQYRLRKDPAAYEKEFLQHWQQFEAAHEKFLADPVGADSNSLITFREQVDFIAHCAELYPEITQSFPSALSDILSRHHATLEPTLREKLVSSLTMLRRKDVVDSTYILTTLFPILIATPSKTLRMLLYQRILSVIRDTNAKTTNHRVNRTMQNVLYNLVTADRSSPSAIWAVKITRELWRRQIWTDAKSVDIMRQASLAQNEKVVHAAVKFFLGGDKEREEYEDESSDDEAVDIKKVKHQIGINKKSKKSKKVLEKAADRVKRQERKKNAPHPLNFSALHLLQDPQGFSETLFDQHLSSRAKLALETKLAVLQLVTRLIGLHKLTVLSIYSWFSSRLQPRERNVTSIMASLAQATHNLVPPDVIEPLIRKIADNFVSEASASEVCSAGLNAIREICARQPLAMDETLLQDLVEYRKSKDKGVMMAAKGLLSLYREKGADMLKKKDRGKEAAMGLRSGDMKQHKYGEEQTGEIEGLELLAKWKEEQRKRKRAEQGLPEDAADGDKAGEEEEDASDSDGWEVASTDSSDSGEWIRVSDSEDEAEPDTKKRKVDSEDAEGEDKENAEREVNDFIKLATTQILTPADLAKLRELRVEAGIHKEIGSRKRKQEMEARHMDEGLTAEQIEAPSKLRKSTKEERIALAKEGKPNREEHKSSTAIRKAKKEAEGKSTTNKEKARKKNFMMTFGKAKSKQKRSLVETRNALKNHVERSKSGGRRRNGRPR